ncbi:hypothetical protein [Alkalihalobacillus sp. TS-13]|uniref:hypothetical protein n=1 Tax=Alkalihalobacillus sp. TS-13 TaxID=2842455 RepID=UPI001C867524|nr:hypothetical protein [Alkalihalobacillus sp. TS-13]
MSSSRTGTSGTASFTTHVPGWKTWGFDHHLKKSVHLTEHGAGFFGDVIRAGTENGPRSYFLKGKENDSFVPASDKSRYAYIRIYPTCPD